jgi:hypothetical protein
MLNNNLANKFATANIDVLKQEILPLINLDYARLAAENVLSRVQSTVDILTDEDPNNQEQLLLIWGHIVADPQIAESIRLALLDGASKVKDETVKAILAAIVEPLTQTIVALNDENKDNEAQIKQLWVNFVKSPAFVLLLLSNLDVILKAIIKNDNVANWIEKLIKPFIVKP